MKWFAVFTLAFSTLMLAQCSVAPGQNALLERRSAALERRTNARDYSEFLRARYASLTNDPHKAAEYYARSAQANPADRDLLERAVFTALISGQVPQATSVAERARKDTLARASLPRIVLGVEAIKAGKYKRARTTLLSETSSLFNDTIARSLISWAILGEDGSEAASYNCMQDKTQPPWKPSKRCGKPMSALPAQRTFTPAFSLLMARQTKLPVSCVTSQTVSARTQR